MLSPCSSIERVATKNMETLFFTGSHMEKNRGVGVSHFWVDSKWTLKEVFFTKRSISHWHDFLREVVDSPDLEAFKILLETVLGHFS